MIFEKHGFSVWIVDSNDDILPEYQVQEVGDDTIQCWIPSTEGRNFKILWKVVEHLHPGHDLSTLPLLDGVRMSGKVSRKHKLAKGSSGKQFRQRIGASTARLYEFGKRTLTDGDESGKLNPSLLNSLNTIKLVVEWGQAGASIQRKTFYVPQEIGPVHEKSVKKGHSGAAQLGKAVSVSMSNHTDFKVSKEIKPITFVFCYAPEDWLRARDIVPRDPELDSQNTKSTFKRERSITPDIIDIDDLETDEEISTIKHLVPAPATSKKQRTLGHEDVAKPKVEDD
ncbi:hypothetical protein RSOLAG22IIIB_01193 [Rhizoctonia solani]|uniref:DUF7918 domain-containing protein n=1 Tax=Rhizoctonia solani TaxID=456999 RepID=A0A0K6G5P9_9AGAM|nr:hypothetical protein RSOLAG22IIIB_01193 [Rhizoctonia solani]